MYTGYMYILTQVDILLFKSRRMECILDTCMYIPIQVDNLLLCWKGVLGFLLMQCWCPIFFSEHYSLAFRLCFSGWENFIFLYFVSGWWLNFVILRCWDGLGSFLKRSGSMNYQRRSSFLRSALLLEQLSPSFRDILVYICSAFFNASNVRL